MYTYAASGCIDTCATFLGSTIRAAFWLILEGCLFLLVSYDMKKLKKKKKKKDIGKESPADDFVNSVIKGIEKFLSPR